MARGEIQFTRVLKRTTIYIYFSYTWELVTFTTLSKNVHCKYLEPCNNVYLSSLVTFLVWFELKESKDWQFFIVLFCHNYNIIINEVKGIRWTFFCRAKYLLCKSYIMNAYKHFLYFHILAEEGTWSLVSNTFLKNLLRQIEWQEI